MRGKPKNSVFILGLFLAMTLVLGLASWWAQRTFGGTAAAGVKIGTHDISEINSQARGKTPPPSVRDEPTPEPKELALANDVPTNPKAQTDDSVEMAETAPSMPLADIQAKLAKIGPESAGADGARLEANLGNALLCQEQPDLDGASRAFNRALDLTPDVESHVQMARIFSTALLKAGGQSEVLDVTASGRFIGARLTPDRLEIELIKGVALDGVGLHTRAEDTLHDAFETVLSTELNDTPGGRDVARALGLRLARSYRESERNSAASAVSRRLRAWLGEESLVLR